ncbi:L,D-transpeptidase [Teredinibacter haidensis]|uniref:L,D-transpeptidase n=1 Tax=Teredinibacter haidensis TaxID=2731755 RepID=UPI0009FB89E9|nr:L,D-transpeptidase [Teredinibacter haidensis]
MKFIAHKVGFKSDNKPADVKTIVDLLSMRKNQFKYKQCLSKMVVPEQRDPECIGKLIEAIKLFQKNFQKMKIPDGIISPNGNTILYLGGIRPSGKVIIVDLDDQNLYALNGPRLEHEFYCASGDKLHPTATWPSLHRITRKHKVYRSRTYDAQMNYAMFFTSDGKAIHQSNVVGLTSTLKDIGINQLGSHGCVRLSEDNACTLFDWAPMNTPVFVDLEKL